MIQLFPIYRDIVKWLCETGAKRPTEEKQMDNCYKEDQNNKIYSIGEIKKLTKLVFEKTEYVEKAYLFGSYARREANEKSDIDIVVTFNTEHVGMRFFELIPLLEDIFKKRVDVLTENEKTRILNNTFERDKVLIYER